MPASPFAGPRSLLRRPQPNGADSKPPRESPLVFHVSVAIDQDGAEDPIRELLQVYDKLLPQVPRWAEPVLPVLSNLASITDATFTLLLRDHSTESTDLSPIFSDGFDAVDGAAHDAAVDEPEPPKVGWVGLPEPLWLASPTSQTCSLR